MADLETIDASDPTKPPAHPEGARGFWLEAARDPNRVAVVDVDGTSWSSGKLLARVNQLSRAMLGEGIGRGSDLAILSWNRAETLALMLAASQIGSYFTLVNTHLTAAEVAHILTDCQPKIMVVDHHTADAGRDAAARAGLDPASLRATRDGLGPITVDQWVAGRSPQRPSERVIGLPMLYTSGTSGKPKGVRPAPMDVDPDVLAAGSTRILRRYGLDPAAVAGNGVHLVTSPLYHAAPMHNALTALHAGHRVVLMERFDAENALRLIQEHAVTWTQVVPTMLRRFMDLPPEVRTRYDTSSLTRLIHAGSPCSIDLKRAVIDWLGPVVWEYYSSTEGGGTVIGPEDWLAHPGSVGRPWPGAEIRILDDDGNELGPGEVGMIYMLSARSFRYHNAPDQTARAQRGDYVTAGDMGRLDEDGYLYIADRRTDLILVGGVNVYPAEIEEALAGSPLVADVAVIGKPHPDLGQVPHAVVEPTGPVMDPDALAADLSAYLAPRLSGQKLPRSYDFRSQLPRNQAGKLLRRVLREELADEQRTETPEDLTP